MKRSRFGEPADFVFGDKTIRVLVRQDGTCGRIAITVKVLDKKPQRSQDGKRGKN